MSVTEHAPDPGRSDGTEAESDADDQGGRDRPVSGLSLDVVFNVLRNRRRRLVLQAVEERDGATTLSHLAEHIGGIENDKPPTALNAQERKRVYVGLYQCHLPKMDDAGAVEFDKDRGTVERGPMADTYHTYLEREFESGRSWARYYGGLTGVSSVALVASFVLFSGITPIVFLATLVALAALSAYHWFATTEP